MPRDIVDEQEVHADPILDILRAGRERIRNGWAGHRPGDGTTSWCAAQALMDYNCPAVLGPLDMVALHTRATARLLAAQLPVDFEPRTLPAYNDHPRTRKANILALYDRAIAARTEQARHGRD